MAHLALGIPRGFVTGVHEPSKHAAAFDAKCDEWTQVCDRLRAIAERDVSTAENEHKRQPTPATLRRLENTQKNRDTLFAEMDGMEVQLDLLINLDDLAMFVEKFKAYRDVLSKRTAARGPSQLPMRAPRQQPQQSAQRQSHTRPPSQQQNIFDSKHAETKQALHAAIREVDNRKNRLQTSPVSRVTGPSRSPNASRQQNSTSSRPSGIPTAVASRQRIPAVRPSRSTSRQLPSRQLTSVETPSRQLVVNPSKQPPSVVTPLRQPAQVGTQSRLQTPIRVPSRTQSPVYVPSRVQSPANAPSRVQSPAYVSSRAQTPSRFPSRVQSPANASSRVQSPANVPSRSQIQVRKPSEQEFEPSAPSRPATQARASSRPATQARASSRPPTQARASSRPATQARIPPRHRAQVDNASIPQNPVRLPSKVLRRLHRHADYNDDEMVEDDQDWLSQFKAVKAEWEEEIEKRQFSSEANQELFRKKMEEYEKEDQARRAAEAEILNKEMNDADQKQILVLERLLEPYHSGKTQPDTEFVAKMESYLELLKNRRRRPEATSIPVDTPPTRPASPSAAAARLSPPTTSAVRTTSPSAAAARLTPLGATAGKLTPSSAATKRKTPTGLAAARTTPLGGGAATTKSPGFASSQERSKPRAIPQRIIPRPTVFESTLQAPAVPAERRQTTPAGAGDGAGPLQSQWLRFYEEICNEVETINKSLLEAYGDNDDQENYSECHKKIEAFLGERKRNRAAIVAAIRENNEDAVAGATYKALRPLEHQTFLCNDILDLDNQALVLRIKELPKRVEDTIDTMRASRIARRVPSGRIAAARQSAAAQLQHIEKPSTAERTASSTSMINASRERSTAAAVAARAKSAGPSRIPRHSAPLTGRATGGVASPELEKLVRRTNDEFDRLVAREEGTDRLREKLIQQKEDSGNVSKFLMDEYVRSTMETVDTKNGAAADSIGAAQALNDSINNQQQRFAVHRG